MSAPVPPPDNQEPSGTEPPDDDLLAGEFVLGVLAEADRRRALARSQTDPLFAEQVANWSRRLTPWLSEIAPSPVRAEVWERLCAELGWRRGARDPLRWSLVLWRTVAALAMVAAVALWLARPALPPTPPLTAGGAEAAAAKPVTTLAHDDGTPGWLAAVDRTGGTVLMVPVPAPADVQGRVPELWIIPPGEAPRSLGAVSIDKAHTVQVPPDSRAALAARGAVLAITLEPASGMPHAAPSGPVVAKGSLDT